MGASTVPAAGFLVAAVAATAARWSQTTLQALSQGFQQRRGDHNLWLLLLTTRSHRHLWYPPREISALQQTSLRSMSVRIGSHQSPRCSPRCCPLPATPPPAPLTAFYRPPPPPVVSENLQVSGAALRRPATTTRPATTLKTAQPLHRAPGPLVLRRTSSPQARGCPKRQHTPLPPHTSTMAGGSFGIPLNLSGWGQPQPCRPPPTSTPLQALLNYFRPSLRPSPPKPPSRTPTVLLSPSLPVPS
mmetsp:Transcript_122795/g.212978  ORF Transcript_122795/g.212978 Transcript_122795/m.212978 type:complete len:245 (+) Transcript_122795:778-1512(+)